MKKVDRLVRLYEEGTSLDLEDQFTALLAIGDREDKKKKSKNRGNNYGKQQTHTAHNRGDAHQL